MRGVWKKGCGAERQRCRRVQGRKNPSTKEYRGCLYGGGLLGDVSVPGRTGMQRKVINTLHRHGSL